jgi:hypothetical protein
MENVVLWMAVETILISVSVFLGLIGQQWYENAQRREEAKASLSASARKSPRTINLLTNSEAGIRAS